MPIIQISFSQEEYELLAKEAEEKGIDIKLLIKDKVLPKGKFHNLLQELENKINLLAPGEIFTVRDLLNNRWGNIEKGMRLSLGRTFNKKVVYGAIKEVEVLQYKDSSNTQLYRKL